MGIILAFNDMKRKQLYRGSLQVDPYIESKLTNHSSKNQLSFNRKESGPVDLNPKVSDGVKAQDGIHGSYHFEHASFESLYENMSDAVVCVDREGRIIKTNRAFSRLFGYTGEEVLGCNVKELLVPPELYDEAEQIRRQIFKGVEINVETKRLSKDGTRIDVSLQSAMAMPNGDPAFCFAIYHDISERLKRERKLSDQLAFLQKLIDTIPSAIFYKDLNGVFKGCNKTYEKAIGMSREDIIGKTVYDIAPRDLADRYHETDMTLLKQGGEQVYEGYFKYKDGIRHDVEFHKAVFKNSMGDQAGLAGIMVDISERKKAETEVARLASVIDQASNAVVMTDLEGKIIYVNPAFERISGYERHEAIGQNPRILKSDHHDKKYYEELWNTITSGDVWKGLLVNKHKDGRLYHEETVIFPIRDHAGEIINYAAVKSDVTETVKARRKAEEANRTKSEFLANMSHEIRTPMNAVIGMTHLALQTDLSRDQQEYLDAIKISAEGLLGIINDILDFSKIEAGRLELERKDFDLREILEYSAETLALKAHEKRLKFNLEIAAGTPEFLVGDPVRLRQILLNLGSNAIKFTETGEIVIRCNVEQAQADTALIHFAVEDTGIGIPKDKAATIFESFQQADGSTTRKYGGTGLGLSISKQLTTMMDGRIWIKSKPGKGSVFHFTARFEISKTWNRRWTDSSDVDFSDKRVLIVYDNLTNRKILRAMLGKWKAKVVDAPDGAHALSLMHRAVADGTPFDLVLMDGQMPGIDGFEVSSIIRRTPSFKKTEIIMMTSMGSKDNAPAYEKCDISEYLLKPVKEHDLIRAMRKLLLKEDPVQVDKQAPGDGKASSRNPSSERNLKILLAEDNFVNQKLAVKIMENWGHSVVVAENGKEALDLVEQERFDLVLMDIQMPLMDGLASIKEIRKSKLEARNVPVIAMTAHAMKEDRLQCLDAGMNDYISKPFDPEELKEMLQKWADIERIGELVESPVDNPSE